MQYQSLEHNPLGQQNMTNLHQIFPEPNHNTEKDDYACLHCGKDLSNKNQKQTVLNRGIYADYLEPEYHRYNKSLKITFNEEDDIGRKYLQYKPRRPKCPIIFEKLTPQHPIPHLIQNPLYNYPTTDNMKYIEQQWMGNIIDNNYKFVKNINDMMDEYDNAKIW